MIIKTIRNVEIRKAQHQVREEKRVLRQDRYQDDSPVRVPFHFRIGSSVAIFQIAKSKAFKGVDLEMFFIK